MVIKKDFMNRKKPIRLIDDWKFVKEENGKKIYVNVIPKRFGVFQIGELTSSTTENGTYNIIKADKLEYLPKEYQDIIKEARRQYLESKEKDKQEKQKNEYASHYDRQQKAKEKPNLDAPSSQEQQSQPETPPTQATEKQSM